MPYCKGDPYWLRARYAGCCAGCGAAIVKGSEVFYWPKGKRVECESCGAVSAARFADEVALEWFA